MADGLRREGGRQSAPGVFSATGTLAGIKGPGWRTVLTLELRNFGPGEDLSVLRRFRDLERLELDHVQGLDLSPVAGLGLKHLVIKNASDLDLSPVAGLAALEWLGLNDIDECYFPPLALSSTLRTLAMTNDDPALTGEPIRQAIEAIRWDRLHGLRVLGIRVGGTNDIRPIEVDLSFLTQLPRLEHLEMHAGVHHAGRGLSPIEPPFHGLSQQLSFVRIDAWDPGPVRAELRAYLGIGYDDVETETAVYQRHGIDAPDHWPMAAPVEEYQPEYEPPPPVEEIQPERDQFDPERRARHRLREADQAMLRRLAFEHETPGFDEGQQRPAPPRHGAGDQWPNP